VKIRDGWTLLSEFSGRLGVVLAAPFVAGAMLLTVGRTSQAAASIWLPITIGALAGLLIGALLVPPAVVLASSVAWRWYRGKVPSPLEGEQWRFVRFAEWGTGTAAGSKARGMVAVSGGRAVFASSGPHWREQSFAIGLPEIIATRLEARRAWHLGLTYVVNLTRGGGPPIRVQVLGAQTLCRLVTSSGAPIASRGSRGGGATNMVA
jgi:hypothetical protein